MELSEDQEEHSNAKISCSQCDFYISEFKLLKAKYDSLHKRHEVQYEKYNKEVCHLRQKVRKLEKAHLNVSDLPDSDSKAAVKIRNDITRKTLENDGQFSATQISMILKRKQNIQFRNITTKDKITNISFLSNCHHPE